MFSVKAITPEETQSLRHLVLWPHITLEKDCVIDIDHREDAIHLGVMDGSAIVSVGSFFNMPSPKLNNTRQYRLRAMATHPDYRGRDCGKMLIEKGIAMLSVAGWEVLWCDARLNAVGFYEKLGFNVLPEIYDVPRIGPHKFMWIEL